MAQIVDSYDESNYSSGYQGYEKIGQSFTSNGGTLNSSKFYLSRAGTVTGNVNVEIYNHSGVYGTSSIPTGAPLATSDNLDASVFSTSLSLVEFTFSGINKISLVNTTKYVIILNESLITGQLIVGGDNTTPTHSGNLCLYSEGEWESGNSIDTIFYVYKDDETTVIGTLLSKGLPFA